MVIILVSNYVSIITEIMTPSGVTTIFSINLANGNKSANGNGTIENGNGGFTRGGGVEASTSTHGPMPVFNLVVEFF